VVHHHVEFALPFFYRTFLIADQDNNGFAPIFLIDKRAPANFKSAVALVPQQWDYNLPRNCGAEDWHFSKDAVSISLLYETAAPHNCYVSVDLHPVWCA